MIEQWVPVNGYEGLYEVSNTGRVRSIDRRVTQMIKGKPTSILYRGRELKPLERGKTREGNHYYVVHLSKNGVAKYHLIHRLVAEVFCEKPDGCDVVNHLDNNPSNNCADNLDWTTYKGNMQHASKQGRMSGHFPKACTEASVKAKSIPVVAIRDGERQEFTSSAEAGRVLGIARGHIAAACRKEYGYKTVGGYEFEYADPELQAKQQPNRVGMSREEHAELTRQRMIGNTYGKGHRPTKEQIRKQAEAQSKPVVQLDLDGQVVGEFPSVKEAQEKTGVCHIGECAHGRRKTAGGYRWRWKE